MNRTSRGSGSGAGLEQSQGLRQVHAPPPTVSVADDEEQKDAFPEFVANGHADVDADKKEVIDAGLKSLDHCTLFYPRISPPSPD